MSKYRVVIRAFTLRRDAAASIILSKILETKDCDVVVASSRNFVRLIKFWNPDAIVIDSFSQINRCMEHSPTSKIILLSGEGGNKKSASEAKMFSKNLSAYNNVDKILLWGKKTESFFHELMPKEDHRKLIVCGNPRLDLIKFNPELQKNSRKTIGIIGRYHTLNRYNRVPAIFSMQFYHKKEGILWQVENFFATINLVHRIISETNYTISIRPHPLEAPEGYDFMYEHEPFKGRVEIDDTLDLAYWTSRQKFIISPSSTSFFESYILGIPMINIDYLTKTSEIIKGITPHAALSQNVSYNPKSFDEASDLISNNNLRPKKDRFADEHLDEFHGWNMQGSAISRCANEIIRTLKNRRKSNIFKLPRFLLDTIDYISFKRSIRRDPLHPNFSYFKKYHKTPNYYNDIASNIILNENKEFSSNKK